MTEGLPLCGRLPHCDQIALDAIERVFSNPDTVWHLKSKKAAVALVLNLVAVMRDRGNIMRIACGEGGWWIGRDGSLTPAEDSA